MLEQARRLIRQASRIVSFSGAGLSAESGVSTFRDAQDGLWAKFDPMQLATPEGFQADPELVINWYNHRRKMISQAQPNAAHWALATHRDMTHITQNVDDLLEKAGASDVIHLHGNIEFDRCHAGCGYQEQIDLADPPGVRSCPKCGAPLRPGVVWFGEMLPPAAWRRAEEAIESCDLMLVVGTSALVYPASGLILMARDAGARVIVVNTQPSDASHLAAVELIGPAGEIVPELLGGP